MAQRIIPRPKIDRRKASMPERSSICGSARSTSAMACSLIESPEGAGAAFRGTHAVKIWRRRMTYDPAAARYTGRVLRSVRCMLCRSICGSRPMRRSKRPHCRFTRLAEDSDSSIELKDVVVNGFQIARATTGQYEARRLAC